ncbi:MAG: hypothetical protein RLO04_10010 [Limnobacter sp.]|uniref:hypothetical protein n=1 Tax=Limnobacter sp. TaxID=2003368 RepID=UPI0032EC219D
MIKEIIKKIIPESFLTKLVPFKKQLKNFQSLNTDYGQWASIKQWASIDGQGKPTPWYTYPATEYLSHLDLSKFKVFEYGSGNSTLWWAPRANQVTSVEDDKAWYDKIKNRLASECKNVSYIFESDEEKYACMATAEFDIFIVDGKHRKQCAERCSNFANSLLIVLDNADWHLKTVELIQDRLGWVQVDFHGFGPINNYTWTTSIFINPARSKELRYTKPLGSKCGLVQFAEGERPT